MSEDGWQRTENRRTGGRMSPVKFASLVFFEEFNGAPITGFPFHSNKQMAEGRGPLSYLFADQIYGLQQLGVLSVL